MIIAFDFDGILVSNAYPEIGIPNTRMIDYCKRLQKLGIETILWTSRMDDKLEAAVNFCRQQGLDFTAINKGAPSNFEQYGYDPRKVYADYYIDDRMVGYDELTTLRWLYQITKNLEKE